MRDLVLSDGHEIGLIDQNVGGLQQWVAEESIGGEVFAGDVLLLLFVGGHALEPAERSDHREQQV